MAFRRGGVIPAAFILIFTLIFFASLRTAPHSSLSRLVTTTINGSKVSLEIPSAGSDLNPPSFDYTYDKMISMSAQNKVNKDPCYDLALPGGGGESKPGKGTTVLVTGGAGFIGSNLVDRLLELGYKVRIFDNLYTGFLRNVPLSDPNVEFYYGDILDPEALAEAMKGIDFVYHLAAMSKVVPSLKSSAMARFCTESNALGTWNVLDSARLQGSIRKVVYAGSSTYYGNKAPPHREEMAPDFLTPYAASKYEGEMQMQMFDRLFDVPTITTRFFMVYGPRQPSTGAYAIVTGVFAKQAAEGKPLTIEGDGTHYRDFIHVSDIVEGLILAQQKHDLRGDVVNLGSGQSFSVNDVANLVSSDQINIAERKNDLTGTLADTCKMKQLLGYKTKKDFKKEMGYMAKQTMEGNVFMQDWLTPAHAISAPHLLPVGNPMMAWGGTEDLDALLLSIKHLEQKQIGEVTSNRNITIIPFNTTGQSTEAMKDVLMNTVHSLVRFGGVTSYMVVAANEGSDDAMVACKSLNMPCYHANDGAIPILLSTLLDSGYSVHVAQVGNSYINSVGGGFARASAPLESSADVIGTSSGGDVLIRSNDRTRAAFAKWSTEALGVFGKANTQVLGMLGSWPEALDVVKAELPSDALCHDGKLGSSSTAGDITCPSSAFYASPKCGSSSGISGTANETMAQLRANGAWHLSQCFDPAHCDRQQMVPLRWVSYPPDLSAHGGFCSSSVSTTVTEE